MRKRYLVLALAAICLLATACDEDDPVKPGGFAVTIKVTDTAGEPVEGLRVNLVNDHQFFQDGGMAAKASVAIPFRTELAVHTIWTIEDIEGRPIRNLWEGDLDKGSFRYIWDGENNAGDHVHSGRYTVHVVATNIETGYWVYEDRTDMLLAMLDSSRAPAGVTGRDGTLVLKDKTRFPHMYDRPDMQASDENGESMGLIELTPLMRISLSDTVNGGGMWFKKVVNESETVNLTWATPPPAMVPPSEHEPLFPGVAKIDTTNPVYFQLGRAYPNPFN